MCICVLIRWDIAATDVMMNWSYFTKLVRNMITWPLVAIETALSDSEGDIENILNKILPLCVLLIWLFMHLLDFNICIL